MRTIAVIAMLLAGCGDDSSQSSPDAALPDAPPVDAPPPAPACVSTGGTGAVAVDSVTRPEVTTTAVIHDPQGRFVARRGLDASGSATLDVPSCGMVTLRVASGDAPPQLVTWVGVQPGDHLVHPEHEPQVAARPLEVRVAALDTATSYRLMVACPRHGNRLIVSAQPGPRATTLSCAPDATSISAIVVATTPTGTSFALVPDVALAATGTTIVTPGPYVAATQSVTATLANAAPFAGGAANFDLVVIAAGDRALLQSLIAQPITGATATVGPLPSIAGSATIAEILLRGPAGPLQRTSLIRRAFPAIPDAIAIDAAADTLPGVEGAIDADQARPTVTLTAAGALAADLVAIAIERPTTGAAWRLIAPARLGTVRYPEVPADLLPPGGWRLKLVQVAEASDVASYDEARGRPELITSEPPAAMVSLRRTDMRYE